MKLKTLSSALLLMGGITMGFGANAALLDTQGAFTEGTNQWSDDFGELWLDRDSDSKVSVGDWFMGGVGITSFPTTGATQSLYHELTGLFAIEVLTQGIDIGGGVSISSIPCGSPLLGTCSNYTFGAVSTGFNSAITAFDSVYGLGGVIAPQTDLSGGALAAGTTVIFYQGTTVVNDFQRDNTTLPLFFSSVVSGADKKMIIGFSSVGDYFSGTMLPTDPFLTLGSATPGTGVGGISFIQTILQEDFTNYSFSNAGTLAGSLAAPNSTTPAGLITGDMTLTLQAHNVPEPASLGLLGMGLLGFAASRRKSA